MNGVYAFIDSQNLNLSVQSAGWKLDFRKFRVYLKEKFGVKKGFLHTKFLLQINSKFSEIQFPTCRLNRQI